MSALFYEPDLELAEAFHNLFFEIILPALIIVGHFLTITKNRAIVVNNYKYRFLEEPKKKDKTIFDFQLYQACEFYQVLSFHYPLFFVL